MNALESNEIWMTHWKDLNDKTEFDRGLKLAEAELSAFQFSPDAKENWAIQQSLCTRIKSKTVADPFVFSVSLSGDDECLWEEYAKNGGACFEYHVRDFTPHAGNPIVAFGEHGRAIPYLRLSEVTYEESEIRKTFKELLELYRKKLVDGWRLTRGQNSSFGFPCDAQFHPYFPFEFGCCERLQAAAATFKPNADQWAKEREVRLVALPFSEVRNQKTFESNGRHYFRDKGDGEKIFRRLRCARFDEQMFGSQTERDDWVTSDSRQPFLPARVIGRGLSAEQINVLSKENIKFELSKFPSRP